ncbi:hypothetical protein [Pseudomonas defluvii]|uniref:hypothetical protein n=1 Tax=Pseudomonas defluvii TaxID=1876757 RepID=UPI000811763A|nr:hypothetical protein [Pseudomonas defluvii]
MSKSLTIVAPVIDGVVLSEAALDAQAMAYMNFARSEHRKLEYLVRQLVIPMLGGYENDLAKELDRHLEQTRTFSGNFCWRHRHLGASHGVVGEGAGV